MAALTKDRNTKAKHLGRTASYRVAASTVIYKGALCRLNATGFLIPADDAAGGTDCVGVSDETVDNSAGADGDLRARCRKGAFLLANDGTVVQASVGTQATCLDDQTVSIAATTTNDHIVGVIDDFDDEGQVVVFIA